MSRSRFYNAHVDDGMRHGGLVPSRQEREQERAIQSARADLARKVIKTTDEVFDLLSSEYVKRGDILVALRELFRVEGVEVE